MEDIWAYRASAESDCDIDLAAAIGDVVPLIDGAWSIEVGHESEVAHKQISFAQFIVAKVFCLCSVAEVQLQGDFRDTRDVAVRSTKVAVRNVISASQRNGQEEMKVRQQRRAS